MLNFKHQHWRNTHTYIVDAHNEHEDQMLKWLIFKPGKKKISFHSPVTLKIVQGHQNGYDKGSQMTPWQSLHIHFFFHTSSKIPNYYHADKKYEQTCSPINMTAWYFHTEKSLTATHKPMPTHTHAHTNTIDNIYIQKHVVFLSLTAL